MAQQYFSNGSTGLEVRTVIDDNFTELYSSYLPLAGGTMFGLLNTTVTTQNKLTPSITSGTLTLDLSASSFFVVSLTESITTFVLQNTPSSPSVYAFALQIVYTSNTGHPIVWGPEFKWASGIAPSLTYINNKADLFTFLTHDGGVTWYSFISESNQ